MSKTPQFHGSDLEQIEQYYHIPKEEIVCFGANVNPLGLSSSVREQLSQNLDIISSYPDREYTALRRTIAAYCAVRPEHVAVGNGSTELISLLIRQRSPKRAVVLGPTYSEYERELALTGGTVIPYNLSAADDFRLDTADLEKKLEQNIDLLIICNPNNPTSSALPASSVRELLDCCRRLGIFVMIDETYVEFAPDMEQITSMPLVSLYDNLMVLRGVSKFFAAPGLRLGYGVTSNTDFLAQLKTNQNPWSLNSIGAYAGELMLSDTAYIARTKALISGERTRILQELRKWKSVKVFEPHANFILVRILKDGVTAFDVFEHAIRRKLMIRDCSSFEALGGEFIRFCIMNPEDNDRLIDCLREILCG